MLIKRLVLISKNASNLDVLEKIETNSMFHQAENYTLHLAGEGQRGPYLLLLLL